MKSHLGLRPNFHIKEERVDAHILKIFEFVRNTTSHKVHNSSIKADLYDLII